MKSNEKVIIIFFGRPYIKDREYILIFNIFIFLAKFRIYNCNGKWKFGVLNSY